MCAPATDVVGLRTPATGLPMTTWSRMTATVSQLSHRLGGRHWTEADSLDIQRTLTCGSGFWRTGRTHGIDLRNRCSAVDRAPNGTRDIHGMILSVGADTATESPGSNAAGQ
jgi:hypothetical protein